VSGCGNDLELYETKIKPVVGGDDEDSAFPAVVRINPIGDDMHRVVAAKPTAAPRMHRVYEALEPTMQKLPMKCKHRSINSFAKITTAA